MQNKKQTVYNVHESLCVSLVLALMGGFLDSYTFILKDGVFANAQTGNLILLSISLFNGAYSLVPQYLLPILFFSLGILLSEFTKNTAFTGAEKKIKIVLLFKAAVLIVIGLTSARTEALFTTCTVSFLAAVQVGTFNKLEGSAVATTMITGNLKSAMQCLHSFLFLKDKKAGKVFAQYIAVIVFFGIGAGTGAFLTRTFADNSIYFCLIFIAAAYGLLSLKTF
ncbi:YoaK family protein [Treponema sp. HNW]|uniref:YoaK family protein n=1 Tax=Treponema sp. HNW TaxID=3116654 RepID=UPI003D138DDF